MNSTLRLHASIYIEGRKVHGTYYKVIRCILFDKKKLYIYESTSWKLKNMYFILCNRFSSPLIFFLLFFFTVGTLRFIYRTNKICRDISNIISTILPICNTYILKITFTIRRFGIPAIHIRIMLEEYMYILTT